MPAITTTCALRRRNAYSDKMAFGGVSNLELPRLNNFDLISEVGNSNIYYFTAYLDSSVNALLYIRHIKFVFLHCCLATTGLVQSGKIRKNKGSHEVRKFC